MELDWNDVAVILAIGRNGNLAGAAQELHLNHSTIFRKLNRIEDEAGVRFFERGQGGYTMTEAGEVAMHFAERMEEEMNALTREVLGKDARLQGKIRMTAPEGLSTTLLPGILAEFRRDNPGISIDLVMSGSNLDLTRREADLALRVTQNPPETSLGRRICDFGNGLYASRAYLKAHGDRRPRDHTWVMHDGSADQIIATIWKNQEEAAPHIALSGNSISVTIQAARAGMGVVCLPSFLGDPDRKLIRIPSVIDGVKSGLWALTHPDLRHTARVTALMRHVAESLGARRELFRGASTFSGS
jgi:DNA-binding transcriptional LysR family regulator